MRDGPSETRKLDLGNAAALTVIVVGIVVATLLLYYLIDVLILLFLVVVVAAALGPWHARLSRLGLPKGLAVLLIYLLFATALVLMGLLVVPVLIKEMSTFAAAVPEHYATARAALHASPISLLRDPAITQRRACAPAAALSLCPVLLPLLERLLLSSSAVDVPLSPFPRCPSLSSPPRLPLAPHPWPLPLPHQRRRLAPLSSPCSAGRARSAFCPTGSPYPSSVWAAQRRLAWTQTWASLSSLPSVFSSPL
jgi:hypothetical protein